MLEFQSEIEGKEAHFGKLRSDIREFGFDIGGNWDFHKGSFDAPLYRDKEVGETIYLRLPFEVTKGMLDDYHAQIRFKKPYLIKHVANVGLDYDGSSLLDSTGFGQFQNPEEKDGNIRHKSKWVQEGEQCVEQKVLPYLN